MRYAEMLMALALALLSLAIMYKAGERPSWSGEARFSNVGFGEDGSPQGGFWPFWVCAIMFICSIWTFVNAILRRTPQSQSAEPYLDRHGIWVLISVAIPVFLLVLMTDIVSMYLSMVGFLFYYLFVLGRHGILLSTTMALVLPFWMYLFFDITMTSTLPKGMLAIENGLYAPLGTWFRTAGAGVVSAGFLIGGLAIVAASVISSRRNKTV